MRDSHPTWPFRMPKLDMAALLANLTPPIGFEKAFDLSTIHVYKYTSNADIAISSPIAACRFRSARSLVDRFAFFGQAVLVGLDEAG